MADHEKGSQLERVPTYIFAVLGASAGITLFVYSTGLLFEWRRLKSLGLPAQEIVPDLSHDFVLMIGGRALVIPLLLGLGAVVAAVLAREAGSRRRGLTITALAVAAWIPVAAAAWSLGVGGYFALTLVVAAVVGALSRRTGSSSRLVAAAVFAAAALVGLAGVFWEAWAPPVHLACATVHLARGAPLVGAYVGPTSDDFLLAPVVDEVTRDRSRTRTRHRTIERVDVLPRREVVRMRLTPSSDLYDGGHVDAVRRGAVAGGRLDGLRLKTSCANWVPPPRS
jgi:hypothetical protein